MSLTLEELAIYIPGAIAIFEEYDLDYYQNGSQTLRAACIAKGIPFGELDEKLSAINANAEVILPLTEMSPDRLIDFINSKFHHREEYFLRQIHQRMEATGFTAAETKLVKQLKPAFGPLRNQLESHCRKEDEILFPWMRKLVLLHKMRSAETSVTIKADPLDALREEHALVSTQMKHLKLLAHGFAADENSSEAFHYLMALFRDFEADFHMHLHIENNILFPKLRAMKQSLLKN